MWLFIESQLTFVVGYRTDCLCHRPGVWHHLEEVRLDACLEEVGLQDACLEVEDRLDHLEVVGLHAFLVEVLHAFLVEVLQDVAPWKV